jgi:hypothetical protein
MTPKKKLEAIRRRRFHLDERIAEHDAVEGSWPDDLSYDRRERRALLDAEELLEAQIVPPSGDKLVSRPRHGGTEVVLVIDGAEVGRVYVQRAGRNLRVSYSDGVICSPTEDPMARSAS